MTGSLRAVRSKDRYVAGVAGLAGLAVAVAAGVTAAHGIAPWGPAYVLAVYAGLLLVAVGVLQRSSMAFEVAGERLTVSIEECLVFLALLTLAPAATPLLVGVATLGGQVASRRSPQKVVFNVGTYSLAAACAAATYMALVSSGLAPLLAAFPAIAVYSLGSNLVVAGLFARLESRPLGETYARRFLLPAALQIGVGASAGVALYGLWLHHPLATVAVIPFGVLAKGYVRLAADSNRKLAVHKGLAAVGHSLAGNSDLDSIADRVLTTTGDVLQPGAIDLVLYAGHGGDPARWSREFEGGLAQGRSEIRAELPGPDAPLGHIVVHPSQRSTHRFGEAEREILRIISGQAATAFRNARALHELLEVKDLNREVLEHAPAGVVRVNVHGRVVQANTAMRGLLGAPGEAPLAGRPLLEGVLAQDQPALAEEVRRMLAGQPFYELEVQLADGRAFIVAGVPLRNGGQPSGGIVLFADITVRKQMEDAVRSQSLARPFVRRLVLDLVGSVGANSQATAAVGRRLGQEVRGRTPEECAEAFRAMGLGDLRYVARADDTYTFEGDDLLTRRARSRLPTCHMALGYIEGAIAALGPGDALGTEVRCQSQGHASCVFVVQARKAAAVVTRSSRQGSTARAP